MPDLGSVLLTGGPFGSYAVAFDPESAADAQQAWPGVPVFSPREIEELKAVEGEPLSLRQVMAAKRALGGSIVTVTGEAPQ